MNQRIISLTHDLVGALPLPVLCVDISQRIVLANEAARGLWKGIDAIRAGRMAWDCLPDRITGRLSVVMHSRRSVFLKGCPIGDESYDVTCVPLTSGGHGVGIVLVPAAADLPEESAE